MRFLDSPCRRCAKAETCEQMCVEGYEWFLDSWKAFNRYAWKRVDEMGRQSDGKFRYELPHLVHSPCKGCLCEKWCDKPCAQRLVWWDARVRR